MDPSNHKAAEGSQRVEQNPESSESFEVEDMPESDNEVIMLPRYSLFITFNHSIAIKKFLT